MYVESSLLVLQLSSPLRGAAMAPDVHTPLESLLLFQTLYPFDSHPPSFSQISDILKTNELLKESDSGTKTRLEPESLRSHYLQLLEEEIRIDIERDQSHRDGFSPRKRKRSIPPLENVDEALQYKHLLPRVVNRLYFNYRDHALKAIQDEERRYRSLQREIQEIERGEWDARLGQGNTSRRESRGVSSIQTILRHDSDDDKAQTIVQSRPSSSHVAQNGVTTGARPDEPAPVINGVHQKPISGEMPQSSLEPRLKEPGGPLEHNSSFLPPPQPVNQGYNTGSPSSDIQRRLPPPNQLQNHPTNSPSTRHAQTPLPPAERSSASPIILPPPPGMLRSSGSPSGPLDTLADMAGQQYRGSPAMPSPRALQHPGSQQSHQLPQPRNFVGRGYPYYEAQPPYQVPYSPYGQAHPPPANYQHQPGIPSYQGHGSPYGMVPQYQSPVNQYPTQHLGYNQAQGYYHPPQVQPPYSRSHIPQIPEQHTPVPTPSSKQRPPKPSPITTSASSTRWKNVDVPGTVRQPSPKSPSPGAVSPISERGPSPLPEPSQTRTRGVRSQKSFQGATESPSQVIRGKGSRARGASRRGRGGRATSVASSSHAEPSKARTRSQSIISQADELSIDQPVSTRKIKPDPSGPTLVEDDASIASYTADESNRKSKRQRRGTNRSLETVESVRPASKRKRESSAMIQPSSPALTISLKPGHILGTRNFPKIAAPLMNDITTHKLGNLFAKPLTDRDAPGYKDLIYRPQDLRSIRNAINAGGKAFAKAAESLDPNGNSSSVWIPETPEVVPPQGIVNSAQLEKELMRVFANAIMFNPEVPSKRGLGPAFRTRQKILEGEVLSEEDEDPSEEVINGKQDVSVVKDTREIFDAVEEKVAAWRSAEKPVDEGGTSAKGLAKLRDGGSEEADELAGAGEEVVGSVEQKATPEPRSKRRRR